jgi:hypothetical protein
MAYQIKEQVLLRSVPTQWNSVAEMLGHALTLCSVLPGLCDLKQFNKHGGVCLRRFMLEDQEWELLEQLYPLLDVSCLFYILVSFLIVIVDVSPCHKRSVKKINTSHISSYSFYG